MRTESDFQVSVIIPVYNADQFIVPAVESALEQPETDEVVLVEDGSPDNSLNVCISLSEKYPQVKLYRHENGKNKGAAASRNLGIKKAISPYVSFLDADDFYLPCRFEKTKALFHSQADADGVYEGIGAIFQDEKSRHLFQSIGLQEITTIRKIIPPEYLFAALMTGQNGYFHFNGFTARRELFSEVSFFDEEVDMLGAHEDTMLMYKLSAKGILYPGNITNPVAMRRVHQGNRITHRLADKRKTYEAMEKFWKILLEWGQENLSRDQIKLVRYRIINHLRGVDKFDDVHWRDFCISRMKMFRFAINKPALLGDYFFWRKIIPSQDLFIFRRKNFS